jgi:hypothetical protein
MQFHTTGIVLAALTVVSAARAQTTQAVEWKVSEGGNGHWYKIDTTPCRWIEGRALAIARGADLASIESISELDWLANTLSTSGWPNNYCHLGGKQDPGAADPFSGWKWLTGIPVDLAMFTFAFDDNPCGIGSYLENGEQDYLHAYDGSFRFIGDTNAETFRTCDPGGYASLLEWSADCNGDGIVDYGQIVRGELADDNHNNIPDVCETSVTGVLPPSVPSQGGVTITINGRNFPDNPIVLVGGTPATNVVRASATRLTATTPAGLPGMTSISVNGFTLPDAFYYRPECGSDLDQNGTVDAGDISIILLDFGPCYQTPLVAPATEVPPLLGAQALPDAPRQR